MGLRECEWGWAGVSGAESDWVGVSWAGWV